VVTVTVNRASPTNATRLTSYGAFGETRLELDDPRVVLTLANGTTVGGGVSRGNQREPRRRAPRAQRVRAGVRRRERERRRGSRRRRRRRRRSPAVVGAARREPRGGRIGERDGRDRVRARRRVVRPRERDVSRALRGHRTGGGVPPVPALGARDVRVFLRPPRAARRGVQPDGRDAPERVGDPRARRGDVLRRLPRGLRDGRRAREPRGVSRELLVAGATARSPSSTSPR
jgi:hypothetical protein